MQKLHLVGFTTDHRALILSVRSGARSGGYTLELGGGVAEAIAEAVERAASDEVDGAEPVSPPPPPRPQSQLSVKEVQARMRAGRSVEEVAAEAGVDAEWVARFAAPVLAEQSRIVGAAQATTFSRPRLGTSSLPLGAAVRRNLAARGVELTAEELDNSWSARQVAEGRWVVTLRYRSRGRAQTPSWDLDVREGTIEARDRLAAELAFVAGPPAARQDKTLRVPPSEPTAGDRDAARRVALARKAAEAQLAEAARIRAKHDAAVASGRRPITRPAAPPAPDPSGPARPKRSPAARPTTPPLVEGRRSGPARPKRSSAARPRPVRPTPPPKGPKHAAGGATTPKIVAAPAPAPKPKPKPVAKKAPAATAPRPKAPRHASKTKPPASSPAKDHGPAANGTTGRVPGRQPARAPVFRGDVVPAAKAASNGTSAAKQQPSGRPPRLRPLRAR